jgi:hypothetical protein
MSMPKALETLCWTSAGALLVVFAATVIVSLVDTRQIDATSVWAKPIKFQLALALHFATIALVAGALSDPWRGSALLWGVTLAAVASTVFEVAYIMLQAGRGQASHFNLSTPFYRTMYSLMAVGAVIITVCAAVFGAAALADTNATMGPATRIGVAAGLIGGTVLTLIVAFRMGGALTHHVGTEAPGAARMPLTGWSLSVGDWRVSHFFATHMMQAVPLIGLAADFALPRVAAVVLTLAASLGWAVLTLLLFRQAENGLPFWAP